MEDAACVRIEALHLFQEEIEALEEQEPLKGLIVRLSKELGWQRIRIQVNEEIWLDTQSSIDPEKLNIQGLVCSSFSLGENVSMEIFQLPEDEVFAPFDQLLRDVVSFRLSAWVESHSLNSRLNTGT